MKYIFIIANDEDATVNKLRLDKVIKAEVIDNISNKAEADNIAKSMINEYKNIKASAFYFPCFLPEKE